ncbi:MAG TPA: hypothetical protein VFD92_05555 [Candidatus Binatia bacterium]|nr:hypothetical protein [Candidatus Binatia bacterium]
MDEGGESSRSGDANGREQPLYPSSRAFVVQFTRVGAGDQASVTGRVEHVQSGRSARFRSRDDLVEFMDGVLKDLEERSTTEDQDGPVVPTGGDPR